MAHFARKRTILVCLVLCLIQICQCEVVITEIDDVTPIDTFRSIAASFGRHLPKNGMKGFAIRGEPLDGCTKMNHPPSHPRNSNWFAVISRYGGCTFEDKVRNAGLANFSAAIVFNMDSNKVIPMGGSDDSLVPSVFIGYSSGQKILSQYTYQKDSEINVWILADEPFDINAYLLPFAIVVGICFLVMLAIVLYKCIQDHRRRRRHRLPKSALKKLPIHKFKDGDPYETCCICLDDFEEGDKLRILPCDHGYHYKCIDPWLVKNKRICPQCRKRVFSRGSGYSGDSDSDNEGQNNERAPLVRPSTSTGGGTFGGPSTSRSTLERLQQSSLPNSRTLASGGPGPSNLSDPEHSRRNVFQQRRLRRAERQRQYEALAESSSSDDDINDINYDDLLHDQHPGVRNRDQDVQVHDGSSIGNQQNNDLQHVSAEIHVQVHDGNDDNESPHEESIEAPEDPPQVVVTGRSPGSHNSTENV